VAGGAGTPEALREARAAGAAGIQGGTLMAFCEESGMDASLRQQAIDAANAGLLDVVTDPRASPTGYPFKIVQMDGRALPVEHRTRRCDLGYLRTPYRLDDGRLSFRCSAEPVSTFVAKGGVKDDAVGRRCLCNALLATTGHGQVRKDGTVERPIITAGDQARELGTFLKGRNSYTAIDVLRYLSADG
jgi:nitronate monooxygenase